MNDKIIAKVGTTNLTITVWLQDATNGSLITGVDVTDLDTRYIRIETDNDVTVSAADNVAELADLDAAHTDGDMFEVDKAGTPFGAYRFDVPDAALAAGADRAQVIIWDAASGTILPCIVEIQLDLESNALSVIAADVAGLDGDAMRGTDLTATGLTEGGTWTVQKVLKLIGAWAAGNWRDKSGDAGTYELLDAEDGSTVILEVTPSETTPQKSISVQI